MNRQQNKRLLPPGLFFEDVPAAQHRAMRVVQHALSNLDYFVECFEASLALFDYGEQKLKTEKHRSKRELLRQWQFIAGRDGALNIYHFYESLNSLRQSVHECPDIEKRLDKAVLKNSGKAFRGHFPNFDKVRHSVGHAAEKTTNSAKHSQHGYTGDVRYGKRAFPVKNFVMIDGLHGREYRNTWLGKIESYEISSKSLSQLAFIRDNIFDAFDEMNARA